jgi:lipopolysaccharide biosynthesis glycosyltransferase
MDIEIKEIYKHFVLVDNEFIMISPNDTVLNIKQKLNCQGKLIYNQTVMEENKKVFFYVNKLIFACVFCNENYLKLLELLLESINRFGKLDEFTNILIYTSTEFANKIKQSSVYSDKIIFEINDTYNTSHLAAVSRLHLFDFPIVNEYGKILYLDTDIIIKDPIQKLFDVVKEDVLYALKEGDLWWSPHIDYWGKKLFANDEEILACGDTSCFCSGIMVFNNCEKIQKLFDDINQDMKVRTHEFVDQGFIVYHCRKNKMVDNTSLEGLVINNDTSNKDIVAYHFAGGPYIGSWEHKYKQMREFLDSL